MYSDGAPLLANQGRCTSFDTTPQRPHRRTELQTAILWQSLLCKSGRGIKRSAAERGRTSSPPGQLCSTASALSVEFNGTRNRPKRGKVPLLSREGGVCRIFNRPLGVTMGLRVRAAGRLVGGCLSPSIVIENPVKIYG